MKKLFLIGIAILIVSASATSAYAGERNIVKIGSDVLIEKGTTVNDVVLIDGNLEVSGDVDGNIVLIGGFLRLAPGVKVAGHVVLIGAGIERSPSAVIGGKITEVDVPSSVPFAPAFKSFLKGGWLAAWVAISMMVLLGFLGLAVLAAALVPEHVGTVVKALERSFASMFLWGILGAFLAGLVLVLLAITIVGIILIPLAVVIITLAWIVGYIASAVFIGKNVMEYFKKPVPSFVGAVLGIVLLFLEGFLPIIGPFVIKPVFLIAA